MDLPLENKRLHYTVEEFRMNIWYEGVQEASEMFVNWPPKVGTVIEGL
jgi:hypothetical protein